MGGRQEEAGERSGRRRGRGCAAPTTRKLNTRGGRHLAEAVVVQLVVLDVPRLDEHPIEPIDAALPHGADAKLEAVERTGRALVVPAVAHVCARTAR